MGKLQLDRAYVGVADGWAHPAPRPAEQQQRQSNNGGAETKGD
jgi:hypothetical protein